MMMMRDMMTHTMMAAMKPFTDCLREAVALVVRVL